MTATNGTANTGATSYAKFFACALAAVILLIIIIAALVGKRFATRYETYMSGLWVGDPAFLKRAQLRDFQLFIAPEDDGCRQGYLIITDNAGEFASNQAITIYGRNRGLSRWTALRPAMRTENDTCAMGNFDIDFDADDAGGAADETPFPKSVKISMSILSGTLTIFDDEKVYAFLRKDLAVSDSAVEAYKS